MLKQKHNIYVIFLVGIITKYFILIFLNIHTFLFTFVCMYVVKMLSMETPQHQAIYAPLSQAMTDSDSEEEIHNSTKHRQLQQLQEQQKLFLQHHKEQRLDLNINTNNRRNPPNTLNLQPKSYQQNRRKLQIERQRQLERNLYPNTEKSAIYTTIGRYT